jgi:SAM-dependent methyltransferase
MLCPGVDTVLDAQQLPFRDDTLRAIVMTDVLHHLPRVRSFLTEAARCVRPGGVVSMIEPWVSTWSRQVYQRLHHEPFRPDAAAWEFPSSGPLSSANGALPWLVFERDRRQFEREFPTWQVQNVVLMMPMRYLVSGGISLRSLMPGWSFPAWRQAEALLQPWMKHLAMFAIIVLQRSDVVAPMPEPAPVSERRTTVSSQ